MLGNVEGSCSTFKWQKDEVSSYEFFTIEHSRFLFNLQSIKTEIHVYVALLYKNKELVLKVPEIASFDFIIEKKFAQVTRNGILYLKKSKSEDKWD